MQFRQTTHFFPSHAAGPYFAVGAGAWEGEEQQEQQQRSPVPLTSPILFSITHQQQPTG
jgi:hypothetical protein